MAVKWVSCADASHAARRLRAHLLQIWATSNARCAEVLMTSQCWQLREALEVQGEEKEDDVAGLLFLLFFPSNPLLFGGDHVGALALGQAGVRDATRLDAANSTVMPGERLSVLVLSSQGEAGLAKPWQADTSFPSFWL